MVTKVTNIHMVAMAIFVTIFTLITKITNVRMVAMVTFFYNCHLGNPGY